MKKIIYNVTVNVSDRIHEEWLKYMQEEHIPDVMNTGKFLEYRMMKILDKQEGETGVTYAIQYVCPNMETYEEYQKEHAPALQKDHTDKYKGEFVAFRTLLEWV